MYAEISVIVEGALDETETFTDQTLLDEYLATLESEAYASGYQFDVYVRWHDHDPGDCECAQYETDHHPTYVYNSREDD